MPTLRTNNLLFRKAAAISGTLALLGVSALYLLLGLPYDTKQFAGAGGFDQLPTPVGAGFLVAGAFAAGFLIWPRNSSASTPAEQSTSSKEDVASRPTSNSGHATLSGREGPQERCSPGTAELPEDGGPAK